MKGDGKCTNHYLKFKVSSKIKGKIKFLAFSNSEASTFLRKFDWFLDKEIIALKWVNLGRQGKRKSLLQSTVYEHF